ncbi:hypothetical protein CBS101457_003855 [Exobasidium rhododendri]|nr:hypothetical protein CBS101457_003855 [Exobasidium rhododendri]
MAWAGKEGQKPFEGNLRQVHVPVLSAPKPVSSEMIPSAGPVAILPTDTVLAKTCMNYLKKGLSDVEGVQVQTGEKEMNDETRGIVWLDHSTGQMKLLENMLSKYKNIGWIQLPMAGINAYADLAKRYPKKIWTSAKGAFSQPVAEHALTLALALLRYLPMRVRATSWGNSQGLSIFNTNIVILGAGGITLSLLAQLEPFTPTITVLRRKAEPLEPEDVPAKLRDRIHVATLAELDKHLPNADIVFAACALTDDTKGCLGKSQFKMMRKDAIVVNVARGEVINTDDLVVALREGQIGGAGLDVTAPEPLPSDHPLWNLETEHENMDVEVEKGGKKANLIITPHTADTMDQIIPLITRRVRQNVKALLAEDGRFEGVVDAQAGY